ncbi:hypothetical protein EDB87DRAFT_1554283, partial [Lactarius vividus]
LFGPLFNWALYGVLCVQIYVYSYNFPDDRRSIKFLAYFVFVLETIQTALTGADMYYWFVTGFGNVERLGEPHFAPIDIPVINGITSLVVQGYFCYRIWVLDRRRSLWICGIIAVVRILDYPRIIQASNHPPNTGRRNSIGHCGICGPQGQYHTHYY